MYNTYSPTGPWLPDRARYAPPQRESRQKEMPEKDAFITNPYKCTSALASGRLRPTVARNNIGVHAGLRHIPIHRYANDEAKHPFLRYSFPFLSCTKFKSICILLYPFY